MQQQSAQQRKKLIGMIHLPALPGEPFNILSFEDILRFALTQTEILVEAGFNGILIENFGDIPFHPETVEPHTIAAVAVISRKIRELYPNLYVGINILRNAAQAALGIAAIVNAHFIRVNILTGAVVADQGIIEGKAHTLLRYKAQLQTQTEIWADLHVKHAEPIVSIPAEQSVDELIHRAGAHAIIVTGSKTGTPPDPQLLKDLRQQYPNIPFILGSGATPENLPTFFPYIDGCIVGTALKYESKPDKAIDLKRAKFFAETFHRLQENL